MEDMIDISTMFKGLHFGSGFYCNANILEGMTVSESGRHWCELLWSDGNKIYKMHLTDHELIDNNSYRTEKDYEGCFENYGITIEEVPYYEIRDLYVFKWFRIPCDFVYETILPKEVNKLKE